MTKTIEFVENEIESLKELSEITDVMCGFSDEDYKWYNDKLQILEQIKCELEAWEELKKHEFEIDRLDSFAEYYVVHIWKPFKPEEIEKIKKAKELEVENE